ncbi:MAG: S41 family peptidase [Candidatus Margulisiibacteriota bacterium]
MENRKRKGFINWAAMSLALLLIALAVSGAQRVRAADELNSKLQVFLQVIDIVKSDHVEKDLDDKKMVYGAIRGFLEGLDDPYTRFMEPPAFKEMKARLNGSYSGIGIYIGLKKKKLIVISPIPDTPADRLGLKAMDHIVTIEGKPTRDMGLEEAVSMIRGPKGTAVKIGILRGKEKKQKEYRIIRDKITIKSVEYKVLDKDSGYIKLNTFENLNANKEMEKAIKFMEGKKMKGLILDLRGNGGGLLANAVEISNMFLNKDLPIVATVDRDGQRDVIYSYGPGIWKKPLVVLIDQSSASASEILAGAIKDNHVGTIVGYHSFGKASVQNIRQLQDGSALLVTIAKYQTPSGLDISKKGIIPDIIVKTGRERDLSNGTEEAVSEEDDDEPVMDKDPAKDVQLIKAREILKGKISETVKKTGKGE